ncbi:MAG: dihydrolipoyl dehydrogenase [Saprospiraceae bacterium]
MINVAIIGSGPGGYVAAIRCAQLGMQVTLIEKYPSLGGTCLNVGCIPSKALLDSSEHFYKAKHSFSDHGILLNDLHLDMQKLISRKDAVISQNVKGIEYLMKKNKVHIIHGIASFKNLNTLSITKADQSIEELSFDKCILATGSKPITPAVFNYDKKKIITSTEALQITTLPKSMTIIGAGVIGLELGSVFARLGTQVDVIEYLDRILAGMDLDCAKELQKSLKNLGIRFHLERSVTSVAYTSDKSQVLLKHASKSNDDLKEMVSDYCLIAIGRKPYTEGLQLQNAGIQLDQKNKVIVNDKLQTTCENVFAIGDVINGPMLAHKAEEEGVFVAEILAGQMPHINYNLIPGVVYSWPEMAGVGYTEDQLVALSRNYKIGKFPFKALGRARASADLDGIVKVICDSKTDEILGVHMVGARAADLIMEAVSLLEFRASAEDMARISHPHPTFSEALKEAALDATAKRSIHN